MHASYTNTFEGVSMITSTVGDLKYGAAFALPGIGIFINPRDINNIDLLRHEFGHILQARKWGYLFFYRTIVAASVKSAHKSNKHANFNHQHTWTEWSANLLAYHYFNKPADWNMNRYPIKPPGNTPSITLLPRQIKMLLGDVGLC